MTCTSNIKDFKKATQKPKKAKQPPRLSVRLSFQEWDQIRADAGKMAMSAYIRERLFGDDVSKRKPRYLRKSHKPKADYDMAARILSALGKAVLRRALRLLPKLLTLASCLFLMI